MLKEDSVNPTLFLLTLICRKYTSESLSPHIFFFQTRLWGTGFRARPRTQSIHLFRSPWQMSRCEQAWWIVRCTFVSFLTFLCLHLIFNVQTDNQERSMPSSECGSLGQDERTQVNLRRENEEKNHAEKDNTSFIASTDNTEVWCYKVIGRRRNAGEYYCRHHRYKGTWEGILSRLELPKSSWIPCYWAVEATQKRENGVKFLLLPGFHV